MYGNRWHLEVTQGKYNGAKEDSQGGKDWLVITLADGMGRRVRSSFESILKDQPKCSDGRCSQCNVDSACNLKKIMEDIFHTEYGQKQLPTVCFASGPFLPSKHHFALFPKVVSQDIIRIIG